MMLGALPTSSSKRAQEAEQKITHLQVQKLIYYAHAWMLGIFHEPLIEDEVEVWRYGPVVPSVYYCLSHNRGAPIKQPIPMHELDEEDYTKLADLLMDKVYEKYGQCTGMELSALTHAPGTPWDTANKKRQQYIPNESIEQYYSKLIKRNRAARNT